MKGRTVALAGVPVAAVVTLAVMALACGDGDGQSVTFYNLHQDPIEVRVTGQDDYETNFVLEGCGFFSCGRRDVCNTTVETPRKSLSLKIGTYQWESAPASDWIESILGSEVFEVIGERREQTIEITEAGLKLEGRPGPSLGRGICLVP